MAEATEQLQRIPVAKHMTLYHVSGRQISSPEVSSTETRPKSRPLITLCQPEQCLEFLARVLPPVHKHSQNRDKLRFLQRDEWNEHNSYEEEVPTCIHYSIEWKVVVNNKELSKDTEQDLVVAPIAYWRMVLQPKFERLLRKKLPQNRHVRGDDTNVIVSVNYRSERDLIKRFEDIDVDWSIVEKQLIAWGDLFRSGKKLRVDLTFNYVDMQQPSGNTTRRGNKRGSSAT